MSIEESAHLFWKSFSLVGRQARLAVTEVIAMAVGAALAVLA